MNVRALLTGIAVLSLVSCQSPARFSEAHADQLTCGLNMKLVDQKVDTHATCVNKDGKVVMDDHGDLTIDQKEGAVCKEIPHLDSVERVDKNAYLIHMTECGKKRSLSAQLIDETLMLTNTENY
jgi:hypothetical protein